MGLIFRDLVQRDGLGDFKIHCTETFGSYDGFHSFFPFESLDNFLDGSNLIGPESDQPYIIGAFIHFVLITRGELPDQYQFEMSWVDHLGSSDPWDYASSETINEAYQAKQET